MADRSELTTTGDGDGDKVVLTGFMGTGKTTVGRILARMLGYEFLDTDRLIEDRHGPIPDIFATQGEDAFRQMEREISTELAERRATVVSTGGRLMIDPHNVQALSADSRVFCLVATGEEILARVNTNNPNRAPRPMLEGDNAAQRVADLLEERNPHYARFAQVATAGVSPAAVATEIAQWMRAHPRQIEGAASGRFYLGASLLGSARRIGASDDPVLVVTTAGAQPFASSIGPAIVLPLEGGLPVGATVARVQSAMQAAADRPHCHSVTVVSVGDDALRQVVAEAAGVSPDVRLVHAPVGLPAMQDAAQRAASGCAVLADVVTMQHPDPERVSRGHLQRLLDEATSAIYRSLRS